MLGIIIGIASVVSVVPLGQADQQERCWNGSSSIGTNTIKRWARARARRRPAARCHPHAGARRRRGAIAAEDFADSVTPQVSSQRAGGAIAACRPSTSQIQGVGVDYFRVEQTADFVAGTSFDADQHRPAGAGGGDRYHRPRHTLFTHGQDPPGGRWCWSATCRCGSSAWSRRAPAISAAIQARSASGCPIRPRCRASSAILAILDHRARFRHGRRSAGRGRHRDAADPAAWRDRFQPAEHRHASARRSRRRPRRLTLLISRHCGDLAGGRRHRGDEHHAGLGARADARDRRAHGGGRAAGRYPAAVPHRGRAGVPDRRHHRVALSLGIGFGVEHLIQGLELHLLAHDDRGGLHLLDPDRGGVRLHAGPLGGAARPGSGAGRRVIVNGSNDIRSIRCGGGDVRIRMRSLGVSR